MLYLNFTIQPHACTSASAFDRAPAIVKQAGPGPCDTPSPGSLSKEVRHVKVGHSNIRYSMLGEERVNTRLDSGF